ncbi:hypothetical protein SS50377_23245 [Spironucleus salmonicida]|nr:hypothetical protein SS50377_23245 [Spironucleus salmonicida]
MYKKFKNLEVDKQFSLVDLFIYDQSYLLNSYANIDMAYTKQRQWEFNQCSLVGQTLKNKYSAQNSKDNGSQIIEDKTGIEQKQILSTNLTKRTKVQKYVNNNDNEDNGNDNDDNLIQSAAVINVKRVRNKNQQLQINKILHQQFKQSNKKIEDDIFKLFSEQHNVQSQQPIMQQRTDNNPYDNESKQKELLFGNNPHQNQQQKDKSISKEVTARLQTKSTYKPRIIQTVIIDTLNEVNSDLKAQEGLKGNFQKAQCQNQVKIENICILDHNNTAEIEIKDKSIFKTDCRIDNMYNQDIQFEQLIYEDIIPIASEENFNQVEYKSENLSTLQLHSNAEQFTSLLQTTQSQSKQDFNDFHIPKQVTDLELKNKEFYQFVQNTLISQDEKIKNVGFKLNDQYFSQNNGQSELQSSRIRKLYVDKLSIQKSNQTKLETQDEKQLKQHSHAKLQSATYSQTSQALSLYRKQQRDAQIQEQQMFKKQQINKREQIVFHKLNAIKHKQQILTEKVQYNESQQLTDLKIHVISRLFSRTVKQEIKDLLIPINKQSQQIKSELCTQNFIQLNITGPQNINSKQKTQYRLEVQSKYKPQQNFNVAQAIKNLSGRQFIEIFRKYRWKLKMFTPMVIKNLYTKNAQPINKHDAQKSITTRFIFSNFGTLQNDISYNIISQVQSGKLLYQKQNIGFHSKRNDVDIDSVMVLYAKYQKIAKPIKIMTTFRQLKATANGIEVKQKINYDLLKNRPHSRQLIRK